MMWRALLLVLLTSCSFAHKKPCTSGGQPAREDGEFVGKKRCDQVIDSFSGKPTNQGKYFEWFDNDKLALEGEYKNGKKSGRWIIYDEDGKKISDLYFENGKEVPRP